MARISAAQAADSFRGDGASQLNTAQILVVVVLYKTAAADSQTITSLAACFAAAPGLSDQVQVLLWDNSPEALAAGSLPFPARYRHSAHNLGLSGAYNAAAAAARETGIPWLLVLDQDTNLPAGFLSGMLRTATTLAQREEIAAVLPTVFVGAHQTSPRRVGFNIFTPYTTTTPEVAEGEAAGINSGSLFRVSALERIGGYSTAFWLDYSDYYVFHQLALHGMRVWHAADIRIEHSMTVMDYDNLMSEWRYSNFMDAEGAFNDLYKGRLENAVQTLRLAARVVKQRRRFRKAVFSQITLRYLVWRLTHSRKARIAHWQRVTEERLRAAGA